MLAVRALITAQVAEVGAVLQRQQALGDAGEAAVAVRG